MRNNGYALQALQEYELGRLAKSISTKMGLDLKEPEGAGRRFLRLVSTKLRLAANEPARNDLLNVVGALDDMLDHLETISRHGGEYQATLAAQDEHRQIHYFGAISKTTKKPVETLYVGNIDKALAITWGYPDEVGVLKVINISESILLYSLNKSQNYSHDAPKPRNYSGITQFGRSDFGNLYPTIEKLLGME